MRRLAAAAVATCAGVLGPAAPAAVPVAVAVAPVAYATPLPAGSVGVLSVSDAPGTPGPVRLATPDVALTGSVDDALTTLNLTIATPTAGGPPPAGWTAPWTLALTAPTGSSLRPGSIWAAAGLAGQPRAGAATAGFALAANGLACATSTSVVAVQDLQTSATGELTSLALAFSQLCDGGTVAARGWLRLGTAAQAAAPTWTTATVPTALAVTTSPAAPAAGSTLTVTATVSAPGLAAGSSAAGRVLLVRDGDPASAATLVVPVSGLTSAAPVTVTAPAAAPAPGSSVVRGLFLPDDATLEPSAAGASVTVSAVSVAPALALAPAQLTSVDPLSVTLTVTPAVAGTMTVTVSDAAPPNAVRASAAGTVAVTATTTATTATGTVGLAALPAGSYVLQAAFVPDDPTVQTVTPVQTLAFTVTPGVPAGMLALTASTTTVDLGVMQLDPARGLYRAMGSLNPVTVTDTRTGDLGYVVSGVASDMLPTPTTAATPVAGGGAAVIPAADVGWTPAFAATPPTTVNATVGPPVPAAAGLTPGQPVPAGQGLAEPRVLVRAAADPATGRGTTGTVQVTATVEVTAPLSTPSGTYAGTITITAI